MRHLSFVERAQYPICILVPQINREEIFKYYIEPFGIDISDILVLDLHQSQNKKKTPMAEMKAYIGEEVQPVFNDLSVEYVIVADADYFKALTGAAKVEANLGYVMSSVFGQQKVIYVPNFRAIFYDPEKVLQKIAQGIGALLSDRKGSYELPGSDIIKFADYPMTDKDIAGWLDRLIDMDVDLTCDIEAFSLRHTKAGIGTITFCWSEHEGISFPVDYVPIEGATEAPFGKQVRNETRRRMLRSFFMRFKRKMIYHSINFDVTVMIFQLFMEHILDTKGLLKGMELMLRNWDCTKLITYLATNSCAGNHLKLKIQAQEFAGNWAMDEEAIKDITKIPLAELLQYNLIDGLSTWFVRKKHWNTLVADDQEDIYENIFKPAMLEIIQMQLTGMPVDMPRALEVSEYFNTELARVEKIILDDDLVQEFTHDYLNVKYAEKMNAQWVKKRITPAEAGQVFNPNSDPQMRALLFDFLKLPVINLTKSKMPSTDGETVEALLNHTTDLKTKKLLEAFQLYTIIGTLVSTFMPSILGAEQGPDGWHYLFGNFNLGGTLSGRLSSSGPNLQNLPSTGKGHPIKLKYAKMIKSCFAAPPGWIFGGIDFSSLEDRISALTTKDPNKLKVYTDGYDGHSLRAYAYWPSKMLDINPSSVESINSIAKKYKPLRDRSKNPTFTLTYQGTKHALMKKYGFTEEEAIELERKYHELYAVSDAWVAAKLAEAGKYGYVTVAFGLRLRTPLLKQVIRGTGKTPYEAEAEARTAGNAMGQSWCLLNSRAGSEFMGKVRSSQYRYDIRPCAQIHDAQYFLIRDDIELIQYTNKHLVKAVEWQEHPDIAHDEVKLGGELSIFYPHWGSEIVIPNHASDEQIFALIEAAISEKAEGKKA